jgi:hypothetical protein
VASIFESLTPLVDALAKAGAEVDGLLAATGDDSDIPTLSAYLAAHPPSPLALALLVDRAKQLQRAVTASGGGKAKNKTNAAAREWVCDEWMRQLGQWKYKSQFGEVYEGRVTEKFGWRATASGRQIATVWLKGLPSAPRPSSKKTGTLPPT